MSFIVGSEQLSWYLNYGCLWHMIREMCMFQCLAPYHGGTVTFRGNQNGQITRVGEIGIHLYPYIDIVLFVKGLKHNMLSISQL